MNQVIIEKGMKPKEWHHKWLVRLTIASGFLHMIVVSMMHRENPIELWYFAIVGLLQVVLGFYFKAHPEMRKKLTAWMIVLNGVLVVLWLMTRLFNAPFASYSEAFGWIDSVVGVMEIIAIIIASKVLMNKQASFRFITTLLVLAALLGLVNYGLAKGSQIIFRGIPVSTSYHSHGISSLFRVPQMHDSSDGHHDKDMITSRSSMMGDTLDNGETMPHMDQQEMDDHHEDGFCCDDHPHDNSDGHHDS